jgi:diadenylate cyclase
VPELLATLFYPHTPLHDGGVIVSGDRIVAARCVFPLSVRNDLGSVGTRHRAALGLSEETDAVVIVVSEESGTIGLAFQGRLYRDVSARRLTRYLNALLPEQRTGDALRRALERLGSEPEPEDEPVAAAAGTAALPPDGRRP